jgi:hypothetical protein
MSRKSTSKLKRQQDKKLNSWMDDAWYIWHLMTSNTHRTLPLSTLKIDHRPYYNATSIYDAYTNVHCLDYRKKRHLYRISKHPHRLFLDSYRAHSPFPVYLSVLRSNGPRCYRNYPDSTCGLILKKPQRKFLVQLYRFIRFWIFMGFFLTLCSIIYQRLSSKQSDRIALMDSPSYDDEGQSQQPTQITISRTTIPQSSFSTMNQSTANISSSLNEQTERQLHVWLQREQNDGFRNLSEICRIAINNTFLKQLVS